MTRTVPAILACSILLQAQHSTTTVTGTYHFTSPQTLQSLTEAAKLIKFVAPVQQADADLQTVTLTFSGPAEAVDFASWLLPAIDREEDNVPHERKLANGETASVKFTTNLKKPREMQELLTVLRTVADIQHLFIFSSNHAVVMRGPDWEVAFSKWIIDQLDRPEPAKPESGTREFTVGGPDYRGLGHGARVNFLASMTEPRQISELLTALRTVADVHKVFLFSASHALVMRAGDTDLALAEWLIQQLDLPSQQSPGPRIFTAPVGDDLTRIFPVPNADAEWIQTAVTALGSELKIKRVYPATTPATIVARGTADQIAAAATWMTAHNALGE